MPDEYSVIGARKGIFIRGRRSHHRREFLEVSGLKTGDRRHDLEEGGENGFCA
ncbi:MAG: hypothetical protein R2755_11230 [Acidimicrobiales bacterium]